MSETADMTGWAKDGPAHTGTGWHWRTIAGVRVKVPHKIFRQMWRRINHTNSEAAQ